MLKLDESPLLTPNENNRLRWAYDCLQIPIPESDEYYSGNTKVTFINQAALTIRLEQTRRVALVRHPHVARPLGSISLSKKWRLDIIQGGETSVSNQEAKRIETSIRQAGFLPDDISGKDEERNCLRIPKTTEEYPNGFPVGYDFWFLQPSRVAGILGRTLPKLIIRSKPFAWVYDTRPQNHQMPDIQDTEYGDLRDSFMQSWRATKSGTTSVIPDKMDRFWKDCINAKQEKRISAGWLAASSRMREEDQSSTKRFDRRLIESSPAFS